MWLEYKNVYIIYKEKLYITNLEEISLWTLTLQFFTKASAKVKAYNTTLVR